MIRQYHRILLRDLEDWERNGWRPARVDETGAVGCTPAGGGLGPELLIVKVDEGAAPTEMHLDFTWVGKGSPP